MSQPCSTVSPDDRLPAFAEVDGFDANAAWDRLSRDEQRRVGIVAMRLSVIGNRLSFEHCDWPPQQVSLIEARESDLLTEFFNAVEPLWARLFGWTRTAASLTAAKVHEVNAILGELLALYGDTANEAEFAALEADLISGLTKHQLICSAVMETRRQRRPSLGVAHEVAAR